MAVRLTLQLGTLDGLIERIVKDRKLLEKRGIDPTFHQYDAGADLPGFVRDEVDLGLTTPQELAQLSDGGMDVMAIGHILYNSCAVLVRGDSPYRRLRDLMGKRIAIVRFDSASGTSLGILAKAIYGLDLRADFEHAFAQPDRMVSLLIGGEVEACVNWPPYSTLMVAGDYAKPCRMVLGPFTKTWSDMTGEGLMMTMLTVRRHWLEEHLELAYHILEAFREAVKWVIENPYQVLDEHQDALGWGSEVGRRALAEAFLSGLTFSTKFDEQLIRANYKFIELGVKVGEVRDLPRGPLFCTLTPNSINPVMHNIR